MEKPAPVAIVSVSGGKDSQETANRAIDAYGRQNVRLVMADTGHEHPMTMEFVQNDMPRMMGITVTILRAEFSRQIEGKRQFIMRNWEYMGVPLARIDRALELLHPTGNPYLDLCMWKGRFPSRKAQFCTHHLKQEPLDAFTLEEARNGPVESWQGVRRDESQNRRDALEYEAPCLDRPWAIVRPIVHLTAQETVDAVLARGQWLNPLYSRGMKRVGCMPCINCAKDELMLTGEQWPEEIDRVREWEHLVADCSKRGRATFFADPLRQGTGKRRRGMSGEYARIDEVVEWSKTSRGGRQFDLIRAIPSETCSSAYGLCE